VKPTRQFIFTLLVLFPVFLAAQSYSVVGKGNLVGVIDNTGKQIVPLRYQSIRIDPAGYFQAFGEGSLSLFNRDGKVLFKSSEYADVGQCGNDLLPVQDKISGLWGYADLKGKIVVTPAYGTVKTFVNGLAVVHLPYSRDDDNYNPLAAPRVINTEGKVLLDFSTCYEVYELDLYPFNDSLVSFVAHVNDASGYMQPADNEVQGFITMRGELLTNTVRKTLPWLSEGSLQPSARSWMPYVLPLSEERHAYCAPDGRVIIPGPFSAAHPFTEDGIAMVYLKGDYFIDLTGNPLYDISRYTLGEQMPGGVNLHASYGNKRIGVYDQKEKRSVYLDTKGRVAITLDSGFFGMDFQDGIAPVWHWVDQERNHYAWTWIDTTGKMLIPFDTAQGYMSPPRSRNGLVIFYDPVSGLMGARNTDHKILISPEWGYIGENGGVFLVRQGPANSRGPGLGFTSRSCGAFSYEGILITKDFETFSGFSSFSPRTGNTAKITRVNFTAKELGELVIDAMGIRENVDMLRKSREERKKTGD